MDRILAIIGMNDMAIIPIIVKLAMAIFCGGVLGIERTKKRRAAGIRTYSMVCLGSAVIMMIGIGMYQMNKIGDATRLGAQVVSGIGFIGAGTIIVTGYHEIKGLTTAAGIWTSACLGLAIGAGYYTVTIISCFLLYSIMHFGTKIQDKLLSSVKCLRVFAAFDKAMNITDFVIKAQQCDITIQDCEYLNTNGTTSTTNIMLTLKIPDNIENDEALDLLRNSNGLLFVVKI